MATLTKARPAQEAKKIFRDRLARALETIDGGGALGSRVHQTRRQLKKARATLKLMRSSIPKKLYKAQNALCREVGRDLGGARDAEAVRLAWSGLGLKAPDVERRLASEARREIERLDVAKSRPILSLALSQARKLTPASKKWSGIKKGLRRSYADSQAAYRKAARTLSPLDFHDWRKRVKVHRYQVDLLGESVVAIKCMAADLKELSDVLGDEHDLTLLEEKMDRGDAAARRAIGRKRQDLRGGAFDLAARIYALRAKEFLHQAKRALKRV